MRTSPPMLSAILVLLLAGPDAPPKAVSQQDILDAMNASQGYNVTATTNGPRFQAEVLMRLARKAQAEHPGGPDLLIGHAEWFSAYLARTGLSKEAAPAFARLSYEHGQEIQIDYRSDRVVENTGADRPSFAASVKLWWPDRAGSAELVFIRGPRLLAAAQGHHPAGRGLPAPGDRRRGRLRTDRRSAGPAHLRNPGRSLPAHRRGGPQGEPDAPVARRPAGLEDARGEVDVRRDPDRHHLPRRSRGEGHSGEPSRPRRPGRLEAPLKVRYRP